MTKTQFQAIFFIKTFYFFLLQSYCLCFKDLPKTVNYEAYHWLLLAKSQNISKRAKITKERLISVLEIAKIFKKVLPMFT